jgi:DNA-directed RNA polymerase specialized sigma24 family protein
MTQVTALAIWDASQTREVQRYAWSLWRSDADAADGIQEAIIGALTRKDYFDATKGKLTTWLQMILKSLHYRGLSRGHRNGTVTQPRVFCPGEEHMPTVADLCDPESILIARETNVADLVPPPCLKKRPNKLSAADVAAIRASDKPGNQLARRYGVTAGTVYRVRRGDTYKPEAA